VTLEISSLRDVDGDIVDYYVETGCRVAGRKLKDLGLPDGVVVAMIARDNKIIMPKGSFQIENGDHVVVVLRPALRTRIDRVFSRRV
jgi:cell volume regulation protein A